MCANSLKFCLGNLFIGNERVTLTFKQTNKQVELEEIC